MAARRIVLDANILVRAVRGKRVKNVITTYADETGRVGVFQPGTDGSVEVDSVSFWAW